MLKPKPYQLTEVTGVKRGSHGIWRQDRIEATVRELMAVRADFAAVSLEVYRRKAKAKKRLASTENAP